ncbi:hypothetical protein [Candidatus Methylocalor cossyra]|uniref:Uncharacterized protein n=1 Tax=Candidatus Methylocalor cossyra TaxID=3108543 RepID=A0ABP1CCS4_9GAMM
MIELKADPDGWRAGAIRLAIYHHRGGIERLSTPHLRIAFLIVATHVDNDAQVLQFLQRASNAPLTSTVENGACKRHLVDIR